MYFVALIFLVRDKLERHEILLYSFIPYNENNVVTKSAQCNSHIKGEALLQILHVLLLLFLAYIIDHLLYELIDRNYSLINSKK